MSDLWIEATYDHEAQQEAHNLEMAKHASSHLWPFLAQAASDQEYADRSALAYDQILTVASSYEVPVENLLKIFDQRFALLMEAKGNPFADDSQDSSGDDSSESKDTSSHDDSDDDDDSDDKDARDDSDPGDDTGDGDDEDDDGGDDSDDTDQQTDKDDDGDTDNADDDTTGKNEDPDQDQDEQQGRTQGITPWGSRYAHLATAIQQGTNPLEWGDAAPFVHSPARKHAADGADTNEADDSQVTDTNVPQGPDADQGPDAAPGPDAPMPPNGPIGTPAVPGMNGGIAATTKPRQLPEGSTEGIPGMPPGLTGEFDPDLNGGDIEQGADSEPPGSDSDDSAKTAMYRKVAAIALEIKQHNRTLSGGQCYKIAQRVYDAYLSKHAEDANPLLYGDRGPVADGPITDAIKNWSPSDLKPPKPPAPGGTPAAPPGVGGAGGSAGELAAGESAAPELLPLLAL